MEERESEGAGTNPPSPWPLGNKGMQLEGQEFLEQNGWGEKVITCLGFHCGNGHTFPWESLVSGGTERGERGRREQRGRERAGSSMGRKEKGKGIFFFFFFPCSHRGAEMNYLSPKLGSSRNNRLNTPQTRILWLQEPGWGCGWWGKRETVPHWRHFRGMGPEVSSQCGGIFFFLSGFFGFFFLLFFSLSSLSLEFCGLVVAVSLFPIFPWGLSLLFCRGGTELDCVSPALDCKE